MILRRLLVGSAAAILLASGLAALPDAQAATLNQGTLETPPAGIRGHALWDSWFELAPFGYEEQEYFLTGTARHQTNPTNTAPYTTRFIVFRPTVAADDGPDFNGTVLLDWTNVTAQFENAVDTMEARELLLRDGYAYVHVSAQAAGICCTPLTPKVWDPVRYAALSHPGDSYAKDIFRQVADAIRDNDLAGPETTVIAAGQSQSAGQLDGYLRTYLATYPDAVSSIDAFLVHGSVAAGKVNLAAAAAGHGVEVLHLLADSEANASEGTGNMDGTHYRLWEVAGSAHADFWIGYQSEIGMAGRVGASAPKMTPEEYRHVIDEAGNYGAEPHPMMAVCIAAGATMPMHYATSTALHRLDVWAKGGSAPLAAPRYQFNGSSLARDADGNALGGIRLPPVDVPVATYRSTDCALGGTTVPFTEPQLWNRYPTFGDYQTQMQAKTDAAVAAGWLLPEDAVDLRRRVCDASHRWPEMAFAECTP